MTTQLPLGDYQREQIARGRFSPDEGLREKYTHLDRLEAQSIYILREAFFKFDKLAVLWSMGKDSTVILWLMRKAFFGHVPVPCVQMDTTYNPTEMDDYRERISKEWNLNVVLGVNREAVARGETFPLGGANRVRCCTLLQRDMMAKVIDEKGFEAVIVGIRRDEDGTRAKERYFSPRNKNFEWDIRDQPPELWDQFKTDFEPGTHLRVHPLLHWTEVNIWEYVDRERIPLVELYYAQNGKRYRSLGCAPCTYPIVSESTTVPEIITELKATKVPERSTRAQDQESEHAFEELRAAGYM